MTGPLAERISLAGRVAVVTGAASGIGRATAILLADAGARVVLADIDGERLAETVAIIGSAALPCTVDVADKTAVDGLAERALAVDNRIDIWVNNAGIAEAFNLLDASEALLERTLAINLKSAYWGCAAAGRAMAQRGCGSIINVSSTGGDTSPAGMSAYAISKAGINALTRAAARELGPLGIRANAVAPGSVDTPMVGFRYTKEDGSIDEALREETLAARRAVSPLGLVGEPEDIADAILYLACDASRFVTGQVLRVNGGVFMA